MTSTTRNRRGTPGRSPMQGATVESGTALELRRANDTIELLSTQLQEAHVGGSLTEASVAQLERQITGDPGWRMFSVLTEMEFSPDGLAQLRAVCRLMGLVNPLIKRGLDLRMVYVHGQGCEIRARATGRAPEDGAEAEQDVNAVVSAFVEDAANQRAVFGQQAAGEAERALGTDGELFIALFTRPRSGWVQARTFSADDIVEIISNPDDKSEPWFYRRRWQRQWYDTSGVLQYEEQEQLYPDVDYRPLRRPTSFAGIKIDWYAPVIHAAVNRPLNWIRGIPDVYAAINWARAYKEFLEQWAVLMKSLARFAWRLTAEGRNKPQAKAAIAAAGTSRSVGTGEANDVGGTAITPLGATLEAIPKSGAVIDSESGRPIAMMVAAALNVPVTMLLGDPGQTGARATAETLDWPTELGFLDRQGLWTTVRRRAAQYAVAESVRAPQGILKGKIVRDPVTEREVVTLDGETDDTIDVIWPPLDGVDQTAVIASIVQANATGTLPPELVLRQLLTALGVRDPESIIKEMVDDDGNFLWPQTAQSAAMAGPGQQAADLARAGGDPATAGPGQMGPDGLPVDPLKPGAPGQAGGRPTPGAPPPPVAVVPPDGIEARMADADYGLFGSPAPEGAEQANVDQPAGEMPDAPFDPAFFQIGAGTDPAGTAPADDGQGPDVTEPTDQQPRRRRRTPPLERGKTKPTQTSEAAGRQGDADYGLGGSTTAEQRAAADADTEDAPAGDQPASPFDPEFFQIDDQE